MVVEVCEYILADTGSEAAPGVLVVGVVYATENGQHEIAVSAELHACASDACGLAEQLAFGLIRRGQRSCGQWINAWCFWDLGTCCSLCSEASGLKLELQCCQSEVGEVLRKKLGVVSSTYLGRVRERCGLWSKVL